MKKKRRWIKWVVLLALAVVIVVGAGKMSERTESAAYREVTVTSGDLTTYYNFDGVVKARHIQTITAQAADTVKAVYVEQNEQVNKGDKLYRTQSGVVVEAGIDGELTGLYLSEDDVISAGMKTAEIIDLSNLEVQLSVDEYDVAAMTPGKQVEVTVLALAKTMTGSVVSLDKNGTASGDLSYYTATVQLADAQGVYPGMQASAKVLRSHAKDAVLLKMDAIQFDEYNQPYVLMRRAEGEEPVRVAITVGASDGVNGEITSGLKAGDTVLVTSGLTMAQLMEQMRSAGM